jgi:hypothetical protein
VVRLAVAALVLSGCGAATASNDAPRAARPAIDAPGGNEQSPAAAVGDAPTAEWRECAIEEVGIALWLAVPPGSSTDTDDGACFTLPFEGATPETAEWLYAIGVFGAGDSHAEALAVEPDGALRFLEAAAEIERPLRLGEGETTLLGAPARWYAVQGASDELGVRDMAVARVRRGDAWIVGVAAVRPGESARLETLVRMMAMARAR